MEGKSEAPQYVTTICTLTQSNWPFDRPPGSKHEWEQRASATLLANITNEIGVKKKIASMLKGTNWQGPFL